MVPKNPIINVQRLLPCNNRCTLSIFVDGGVVGSDAIGTINFTSFDAGGGNAPAIVGQIESQVRGSEADYGPSDNPTAMIFKTGDNNSGDLVEILRLNWDTGATQENAIFKYNLKVTEALGVGLTPSSTDGRIDATNDVVAFSTSDIRFKENVTPIQDALFKVQQLQGVKFDWKSLTKEEKKTLHSNEGHDIGVIAQEVEKVLPEVVQTRAWRSGADWTVRRNDIVGMTRVGGVVIENLRKLSVSKPAHRW